MKKRIVAFLPNGDWQELDVEAALIVTMPESAFCDLVSGHASMSDIVEAMAVKEESATVVRGEVTEDLPGFRPPEHTGCLCDRA